MFIFWTFHTSFFVHTSGFQNQWQKLGFQNQWLVNLGAMNRKRKVTKTRRWHKYNKVLKLSSADDKDVSLQAQMNENKDICSYCPTECDLVTLVMVMKDFNVNLKHVDYQAKLHNLAFATMNLKMFLPTNISEQFIYVSQGWSRIFAHGQLLNEIFIVFTNVLLRMLVEYPYEVTTASDIYNDVVVLAELDKIVQFCVMRVSWYKFVVIDHKFRSTPAGIQNLLSLHHHSRPISDSIEVLIQRYCNSYPFALNKTDVIFEFGRSEGHLETKENIQSVDERVKGYWKRVKMGKYCQRFDVFPFSPKLELFPGTEHASDHFRCNHENKYCSSCMKIIDSLEDYAIAANCFHHFCIPCMEILVNIPDEKEENWWVEQ